MNVDELVARLFPELAGRDVAPLGEGTDHRVVLVGGETVIRFPKRADVAEALARETRVLPRLAASLPLAVPDYHLVAFGPEAARAGAEHGAAGYTILPGRVGLGRTLRDDAAASLGAFLRVLHDVSPGVDLPEEGDETLDEWLEGAREDAEIAATELGDDVIAAHRARLDAPPTSIGRVRLVHGDFAAEHVLLDDHETPLGIIDWTDMVRGDPARDLAGILHWGGAHALERALAAYGQEDDVGLVARVAWYAACRALADVAFGVENERREYVSAGVRALEAVASLV